MNGDILIFKYNQSCNSPLAHFFPTKLTLIHGVNNKGNRHGQHDYSVKLRSRIVFIGKRQNGDRSSRQNNRYVQPRQECTLVCKKYLRLDFNGSLALFHKRAWILFLFLEQVGKEVAAIFFCRLGRLRRWCMAVFFSLQSIYKQSERDSTPKDGR